jgi:hypothetical protein
MSPLTAHENFTNGIAVKVLHPEFESQGSASAGKPDISNR